MEQETWRQCVRWLIDTGVLPRQHRTSQSYAVVFDLAQTLRDGVVLCNLLNVIKPGAVDFSRINLRPQMLQFLCLQNIRTVLESLKNIFGIGVEDLFYPEELFEMTNFPKVLRVLSLLSQTPVASSRFKPFVEKSHLTLSYHHDTEEEDIYRNLPDLASDRDLADEEDLYDCVAEEKEEEEIYGSLIAKTTVTSPTTDKRGCCVNEIIETERNYVQHLDMMLRKFKEPLQNTLTIKDLKTMFINMDVLYNIHKDFLTDIERSKTDKLSQPFLKYKDRFLVYGEYCSSMTDSQDLIEEIMKSNDNMRLYIEDLQNQASPSKFKLRELICVPMQRVLKYHLLIKELNKHTPDNHADKKDMFKALEAMQELSHYVNEVKRDSEMLININKVESCLTDYNMQSPLYHYGRLLKDGELKVKGSQDKNSKQRNTFLFDQAIFMTKADKNGTYSLKDLVRLEEYRLDETMIPSRGGKWTWSITLTSNNSGTYILYAKTDSDRAKWLESIKNAFDNINPHAVKSKQHWFKMKTFTEATYCNSCSKLLLGTFYQGYICQRTNAKCHKMCLADMLKKIENNKFNTFASEQQSSAADEVKPPVPNRGIRRTQTMDYPPRTVPKDAKQQKSMSMIGLPTSSTSYKAHRDYNGHPPAPFPGASIITFAVGEPVEVVDKVTADWWVGSTFTQIDRKGYFPASYVSPVERVKQPRPLNYMPVEPSPGPKIPPQISPIRPPSSEPQPLEDCVWYAGVLDRNGAEMKLGGKPSGTFLVRTRDGHMAISLCYQADMKHIKINKTNTNLFYVAECKNFRTVQELVRYYQENSMSSSFFGLETNLKYPYRDPNFFPGEMPPRSMSKKPQPSMFSRPTPPPPVQAPSPNVNPISNGMRHLTVNGRSYDLLGQAKVLYDFEPRSQQEIALRAGQIVNIISKAGDSHGWWKGEHDGQVGYFPATFIQELD